MVSLATPFCEITAQLSSKSLKLNSCTALQHTALFMLTSTYNSLFSVKQTMSKIQHLSCYGRVFGVSSGTSLGLETGPKLLPIIKSGTQC